MKKLLMFLTLFFITLLGINEVNASHYSDCKDKCKNDTHSDTSSYNKCLKSCDDSLEDYCKSKSNGSSIAYDNCMKQGGSTSDSSLLSELDDVQCTYNVDCDELAQLFPGASIASNTGMSTVGLKKSISQIKISIINSKMSVLVDGTKPSQEELNNKMVASFCGYDYNGANHSGIEVTNLVGNDDYKKSITENSLSCPYLVIKYNGTLSAEKYNESGYDDKFVIVTGSKTTTYYNGSTTEGSSNNKFTCFYECKFNGDTETVSIDKNLDSSFTLNARYYESGAYSSNWYDEIREWGSYDDCSSKLYTYGSPGSLYITSKTKKNDNSYGTCTKINASKYYGVSIIENVKDDYTAVCGILTKDAQDFIYRILDWIKYGALVLTIGLSIFDFFKAVASEEDDAFKKAAKKLMRRVIVVVILFLLPVILEFILKLTHIQGVDRNNPLCTK